MSTQKSQTFNYESIIQEEDAQLKERREKMGKLFSAPVEPFEQTRFGIALSGGGIRSATINLGFLKTLNLFGILQKADYLSTVSGGGYTGAYVQSMLKEKGSYKELFQDEHIEYMRNNGEYLIPGQTSLVKFWNTLILVVGYSMSLLMSLLSPLIVFGMILFGVKLLGLLGNDVLSIPWQDVFPENFDKNILYPNWGIALAILLGIHFLGNLFFKFSLRISHFFITLETVVLSSGVLIFLFERMLQLIGMNTEGGGAIDALLTNYSVKEFFSNNDPLMYTVLILALLILGFFTNPNALSFHRFYRSQLAKSFLAFAPRSGNAKLKDLFSIKSDQVKDWLMPYPIINTCLNLQNPGGDAKFKGTKASDYFLLSPLFCGAKLTKYVRTKDFEGFNVMSLPAATTISAAALNPGMGNYSSKLLSILMTIFNARLGYWVNNPLKKKGPFIVWWPAYFFKELFANIGSGNAKVNISDGGHIENLGVYELLRRRCRLILAVDGGADPNFIFSDLENLTIRARNELGVEIRFRDNMIPEDILKVRPSEAYSERRFAVADLYQFWEEFKIPTTPGCFEEDEDGKEVEVLVNYMPDGKEEPEWFVKGNLSREERKRLLERAQAITHEKLEAAGMGVDKPYLEKLKFGTMVYVKSSITAPTRKPFMPPKRQSEEVQRSTLRMIQDYFASLFYPVEHERNLAYSTYKYKIYHPSFPHESTADQFFDPVQWESYYQLGQFIGADVLGVTSDNYERGRKSKLFTMEPYLETINGLIHRFDNLDIEIEKERSTAVGHSQVPPVVVASDEVVKETFVEEGVSEMETLPEENVGYRM